MAATPYPLPRETRESTILVGDGSTGPYGPTTFKVFDTADIEVWAKATGEVVFSKVDPSDFTAAKTAALAYDTVSVTFDVAVPATTSFVIQARRTHEREVAVTRAGAIDSDQLERELTRQGTVVSELRRDTDRAVRVNPGQDQITIVPGADGTLPKFDANGNLVDSGASASAVETVAGIAAEVETVAGVAADVQTVAGLTAEIAALPGQVSDAQAAAGTATSAAGTAVAAAGTATTQAGIATTKAGEAAASAAGVNLPPIQPGDAGKQLFVKGTEDGYELNPPAAGDASGPAGAVDGGYAKFDGTSGKLLKDGGATIPLADLGNGAAVSVLGRSANSAGVRADIAAGANDRLLRRVSDAIDFGQLTAGMVPAGLMTFAMLASAAIATNSEMLQGTASKLLTAAILKSAVAYQALTDGANIAFDMASGNNGSVQLGGNRTLSNMTNATPLFGFVVKVTATGSTRTLALGGQYVAAAGVEAFPISVTTSETVFLVGFVDTTSRFVITGVVRT